MIMIWVRRCGMYFTVDRIENGIAVLLDDDGNVYYYSEDFFENGTSEGTVYSGELSEYGTPEKLIPEDQKAALDQMIEKTKETMN